VKPSNKSLALAMVALCAPAQAIEIEIDYTYDTNGFFNQPGSKEALRAVADYYEGLIHDQLLRIDASEWPSSSWSAKISHPGTGDEILIPNLVVPESTLIIYAGGRTMSSPSVSGPAGVGGPGGYSASGTQGFLNRIAARGQAGALTTPKTDFGPWGGTITFDQALTWNFSTETPVGGGIPFISIALHEIGHLLGIGLAPSWTAQVSGALFTGSNSTTAYGSNVPVQPGGAHWRDDAVCQFPDGYNPSNVNNVLSKAFGSFGTPHGRDQISLMDPGLCAVGNYHKVMTDLDLAGLRDIGWEMVPPVRWLTANTKPPAPIAFTWPSTSNFSYRVERSTTLEPDDWETIDGPVAGNGLVLSYTDPAPPEGKAFYRLTTEPPFALRLAPLAMEDAPSSAPPLISDDCRILETCCP
jgi:hypothetical protein